jgi:RNA polymerase sigma-70 factor (ECF subfamily)
MTSPHALFAAQRRRLWGIAYRMTGSAEDAADVVQEAFARLLERGPKRETDELGFWLIRVTINLATDALRRRKRRAYIGPWLPTPVVLPDEEWSETRASEELDPGARYEQKESATLAFLVAIEALGPRQRAVLVLRDVVGASACETAKILRISEGNVRVILLRARRLLEEYDRARCVPTRELVERHRAALEGFLAALSSQDPRAVEAWLAESVRTVTDAAGEYTALASTLVGRERVARFYLRATHNRQPAEPTVEILILNGLPTAVIRLQNPQRRQAPVTVVGLALDGDGQIERVITVLAPRKLVGVPRPSSIETERQASQT